jgi:hypothetical protein
MTIARSLVHNAPIEVSFPEDKPLVERIPRMRYNVMLHKIGGRWNEFYLGYVVTHLGIHDWCDWKGHKLVRCFMGTREALPHEKTDLM